MADQGKGGPQLALADLPEGLEAMDQVSSAPGVGTEGPNLVVFNTVEPEVLAQLRGFPLMDELRWATLSKKQKTFMGQIALVVNKLRVLACDILFMALQGTSGPGILDRHRQTLQIFSLVSLVCSDPTVLHAWRYTPSQQLWLVQRIGPVVGAGRHIPVTSLADGSRLRSPCKGPVQERIEQAPFLSPLLCALVSVELPLWPLAQVLARAARGWWTEGDTIFVVLQDKTHAGRFGHWWLISPLELPGMGTLSILCQGSDFVQIEFMQAWPQRARPSNSHFMPSACRIPLLHPENPRSTLLAVPSTDAAYLALGSDAWESRLGHHMTTELRVLLAGNYCVSRSEQQWTPIFNRNHASWSDEAEAALWPTIAKWLWKGILEYVCRHHNLPLCILACGAVPKATAPFYRLITDFRPTNIFVDDWRVKYITIKGLSLVLSRCSIWFWRDLESAYLQSSLGGCGRPYISVTRWILSQKGTSYVPMVSRQHGCGPGDCSGWCEKALSGVCLGGHVMRFAGPQFGGKVSHGPLFVVTEAFIKYIMRMIDIYGAAYVDDLFFALLMAWHGVCAGLAGGCQTCLAQLQLAKEYAAWIDMVLEDLHLLCSKKLGLPGQRDVFMGVIVDTFMGQMLLTAEKLSKIMLALQSLLTWNDASPRDIAQIRGKLQNYSLCIQRIKPLIVPFTVFIGGPTSDEEWDHRRGDLVDIKEMAKYLILNLPALAALGAPLWELETITLHEHWCTGRPTGVNIFLATWDAAIPGVAMVFRNSPHGILSCVGRQFDSLSTVATFPRELALAGGLEAQVHREAWGGVLAFKTLLEKEEVRDCVVFLRNDCAPGLAGLQNGSSRSPILQAASIEILKLAIPRGIFPKFLHVSGEELIREQVDDGSRAKARSLQGPACGADLRAKIVAFATKQGWQLTIDFFASACNRLTERYMSWSEDPNCELVDAFAARSWNSSPCPHCDQSHRETGFFFPPNGLQDRIVRRARSDGARGVFLVPCNPRAPFYVALQKHAVAALDIPNEPDMFTHTVKPLCKHTLMAVDFGSSDACTAGCGQETAHRPQGRFVHPVEAEETAALVFKMSNMAAEHRQR